MARTIDTRSLFERGYTVELNPICDTAVYVYNADCSERYSVDAKHITCECEDFRFHAHKGHLCKHITGLALLVKQQRADYYRQQERFAEIDRRARTDRERQGAKNAGEACIRLATELEWFQEDMGLVVVAQRERMVA